MSDINTEMLLKDLKFTGMSQTIEARLTQAREDQLDYGEFIDLLLQDERQYRENLSLERRTKMACFDQMQTFEHLDLSRYGSKTTQQMRHLMTDTYLRNKEHVIIVGPTGTGKTHLAQALGIQACRKGFSVRFIAANNLYRILQASRADDTWKREFAKFTKPDLLIIDDFGLKMLTSLQADDFYELVANRFFAKPCIITSNRSVEGWLELFLDPVMANASLDRLANRAHHIVLDGESYRKKTRPQIDFEI